DRVHRVARRLEDGVGPHPLPRLPRCEDDPAIHLAGMRLDPRRPPGDRPGAARTAVAAPRRNRRAEASCVFLQEPDGGRGARLLPAVHAAGGVHCERKVAGTLRVPWLESSRHAPRAVAKRERHTECACYLSSRSQAPPGNEKETHDALATLRSTDPLAESA